MDEVVKFIDDNAVDEGFLQNWQQDSVSETDTPVTTDEHTAELHGDFYLIPKEVSDRMRKQVHLWNIKSLN